MSIEEQDQYYGYVCVVDRLKEIEMERYKKYRATSRPTMIAFFNHPSLAAKVFADGKGIVQPHEGQLWWPQSWLDVAALSRCP